MLFFLKLNIHHVTNTQYLQLSNCWENNCLFNPQLLLYIFRNFIILFYINLITSFSYNPTQTHGLFWLAIFYLQLDIKYSWYLLYLAVVCHNQTIYVSTSCQSGALNTLLAHQDYVTTQWDLDQISKASLTFNQSFYYLLEMCCNGTLDQKNKHPKRKHFQLNPSNAFSTWHVARSDIISHLMLKSQQLAVIPKIARSPSKISYNFQPNP